MRTYSNVAIAALLVMGFSVGCKGSSTVDDAGVPQDASMSDGADSGEGSDAGPMDPDPLDPSTWVEPQRPTLAPAPAWVPDFPVLGAPGWRDSDEPLCVADTGDIAAHLIFANPSGVYVFARIQNNPFNERPWANRPNGAALYFNDGTGWVRRFWAPADLGFPSSASSIYVTDAGSIFVPGFGCGIMEILPGPFTTETFTCSLETSPLTINTLFVQPSGRAHALHAGMLFQRSADTGVWTDVGTLPSDPSWATSQPALWSNDEIVIGAAANQNVFTYAQLGLDDLTNEAPGGTYVSVFGFSETDIWLGTSLPKLVHYDGASWDTTALDLECDLAGVTSLWGTNETLFFATRYAFGRIDEDGVDIIVDLPCSASTNFKRISGLSETEVFLSIADEPYAEYACGATFTVWYDGSEFHRF